MQEQFWNKQLDGHGTVQAGDNTSDLTVNGPLTLSAGTIADAAGNSTTLTIPGGQNIADSKAIVVDGIAPTITNVTSSTGDGTYKVGDAIKHLP